MNTNYEALVNAALEAREIGVVVHISFHGYAFLWHQGQKRRVFFHYANWKNPAVEPAIGDEVSFRWAPSRIPEKPDMAVDVTPTGRKIQIKSGKQTVVTTRTTYTDGTVSTSVVGGA